jgi:hypothetical protein
MLLFDIYFSSAYIHADCCLDDVACRVAAVSLQMQLLAGHASKLALFNLLAAKTCRTYLQKLLEA